MREASATVSTSAGPGRASGSSRTGALLRRRATRTASRMAIARTQERSAAGSRRSRRWRKTATIALARAAGVDQRKLDALAASDANGVHTPLDSLVLEYAPVMTATPSGVTEELVEDLRVRFNAAMGIAPENCDVGRGHPG